MSNIVCETPRLILRKIVESDFDEFMQILSHPEVMRYSVNGAASEEGVYKFIHTTLQRYDRDGTGTWAIVEKASNKVIGDAGISVKNLDMQTEHEVTFRLSRKNWGKGFGTEAALAARDYGFKNMQLDRLISIVEKENKSALRVVQKLGMTLEKESNYHHKSVLVYTVTTGK